MRRSISSLVVLLALAAQVRAADPTPPPADLCLRRCGEPNADVSLGCPPEGLPPCVNATPSATWTVTSTFTHTQTFTATATRTATATGTNTSATFTSTRTPTVTQTPTPTDQQPLADWSSAFVAVWEMAEASSTTRVNTSTTSCGSACDLAVANTSTQDTTNFITGSASQATSKVQCAAGTCSPLNIHGSESWGCFMFAQPNSAGMMKWTDAAGSNQATDSYLDSSHQFACAVTSSGGTRTDKVLLIAKGATWGLTSCRFDDAANTLQVDKYEGIHSATTATGLTDMKSVTTGNFTIHAEALTYSTDECYVYSGVLSDDELCRICSCAITGELCLCNGSSYASNGRNASCGCSLAGIACDLPRPGSTATATSTRTVTNTPTVTQTPTATPTATTACGTTTDPAFDSGPNFANIVVGSVACTAPANLQVNSLAPYVTINAGNIRCAAGTVSGLPTGTFTTSAACLTASTAATMGRMTLSTTTPASCTFSAAADIYCVCNTDSNTLSYGLSDNTGNASVISTDFPITYPSIPSPLAVGPGEGTYACYANITLQ